MWLKGMSPGLLRCLINIGLRWLPQWSSSPVKDSAFGVSGAKKNSLPPIALGTLRSLRLLCLVLMVYRKISFFENREFLLYLEDQEQSKKARPVRYLFES